MQMEIWGIVQIAQMEAGTQTNKKKAATLAGDCLIKQL